jgi:hypothetical protein
MRVWSRAAKRLPRNTLPDAHLHREQPQPILVNGDKH